MSSGWKFVVVLSTLVTSSMAAPEWSDTYTVFGILSIPFAEIEEPFAAFADLSKGMSRIDYYAGMDKTFQRRDVGQFGTMFKVEFLKVFSCFQLKRMIEPRA